MVVTRAQKSEDEENGASTTRKDDNNNNKRQDPVLRRRKKRQPEPQVTPQAVSDQERQIDAVNPISLGRRARKEVDSAWRRFTRLGQFASTSISEYDVERAVDLGGLEAKTGFEIPQAIDTRVLVVGATGQIGRIVLTKLLLRGYTVRAMVQNLSDEVLENIPPSVELIKGDVSQLNDTFEATRDCDKVICCSKAKTNLMADITRVENTGVQNIVTSMLHHKNEKATIIKTATTKRANKVVLFKFQKVKNSSKWGKWKVLEKEKGQGDKQVGESTSSDFGYLGQSALPKVEVQMPTEENQNLLFEGSNTDFAETSSPLRLPEGLSLKDCEGLVFNLHGFGKKFAVVLYSEDDKGRHAYVSEFRTDRTGYCTRRIPFSEFTRLKTDQPPLNLKNVKEIGFRYRSAWNKSTSITASMESFDESMDEDASGDLLLPQSMDMNMDPRNFRLKLDWVKALPSGPESDVILLSCSGQMFEDGDERERFLKPKRAGEAHLRNSGLGYTIIRPSTVVDSIGGQKALLFDQGSRLRSSISSADVADVAIRCLHSEDTRNKTFEVSNETDDDETADFELIAHVATSSGDYVGQAVQGLSKNT
jgi:uncharacterized protein YbjT (DUF2867 family)